MGATKKHSYSEEQIETSNLFKAMGHPARTAIIESLASHNHLNCNDLRHFIPLSQSSISRHIQILSEVGILGSELIGNQCFYRLNIELIESLSEYISSLSQNKNTSNLEIANTYFKPRIRQEL